MKVGDFARIDWPSSTYHGSVGKIEEFSEPVRGFGYAKVRGAWWPLTRLVDVNTPLFSIKMEQPIEDAEQ